MILAGNILIEWRPMTLLVAKYFTQVWCCVTTRGWGWNPYNHTTDFIFCQMHCGKTEMLAPGWKFLLSGLIRTKETCSPGGCLWNALFEAMKQNVVEKVRSYSMRYWIMQPANPAAIDFGTGQMFPDDKRILISRSAIFHDRKALKILGIASGE